MLTTSVCAAESHLDYLDRNAISQQYALLEFVLHYIRASLSFLCCSLMSSPSVGPPSQQGGKQQPVPPARSSAPPATTASASNGGGVRFAPLVGGAGGGGGGGSPSLTPESSSTELHPAAAASKAIEGHLQQFSRIASQLAPSRIMNNVLTRIGTTPSASDGGGEQQQGGGQGSPTAVGARGLPQVAAAAPGEKTFQVPCLMVHNAPRHVLVR